MFGNPINLEGLAATCIEYILTPPVVPFWECGTKLVSKLSIQCRSMGSHGLGCSPRLQNSADDRRLGR